MVQVAYAVDGFLTGYFSTCSRSEKTKAAYKGDMAQFRTQFGSDTLLSAINTERLERWAKELQGRGYATVTIRRKFATARVFFSYWVRKGLLESSPLWKMRLDLVHERLLPRALSPSDAKRLIEQSWCCVDSSGSSIGSPRDPRFLAIRNVAAVEILFATGMRVGELVSLMCEDWHEDDSAFVVMGKGSRQRLAILPDERSQKALSMYLRNRKALNLGHDALLVNASGRRISTQGIAKVIATAAKESEIKNRVTPHMIRHTLGTLLLRCGADLRVVQEVLGHASIATTQRYTHISKEHLLSTLRTRHPNYHLRITIPPKFEGDQLSLPLFAKDE
jgi:site-specific recombinase XerD